MHLWIKESSADDAFYVDLFGANPADLEFCSQNYEAIQSRFGVTREKKNDQLSLAYRKNGNQLFGECNWTAAMEKYNDSLRFAETGSSNVSVALANRSACFFHLKMYDECLTDIETAKRFGCPEHLMPKLEQRKQDCLKNTKEETVPGAIANLGRKLSFEPDESVPSMANVLQINSDDNGRFSIVAKVDIGVGETIAIEKPFTSYLYMNYGHKCNICLKGRTNLRQCNCCTAAMFCSDECESHYLHELECNLKFCDRNQTNGQILENVRLILMIMNHFANANELIRFVEQVLANDRSESPIESLADFQSNYRTFLKCQVSPEFAKSDNFLVMTYCSYTFSLTVPTVSDWFPSPMHRRFLAHLIGHHVRVLEKHASRSRYIDNVTDVSSYVGLLDKCFEHSCAPNVFNGECNGNISFVTIRPIAKGDHLQICYVEPRASKAERQLNLQKRFQINCKCVRCSGSSSATTAQLERISSDPDVQEILGFNLANLIESEANKTLAVIEKCIACLEKYRDISWCQEIEKIVEKYIRALRIHFTSPLLYSIEEILMKKFENV